MLKFDYTFLWTFINLIILYIFLKKVLFNRIGDMLKKRSESIAAAIAAGDESRAEGETFKKQCQDKLATADKDSREILEEARQRSQAEYETVVADARREAQMILANARAEIERERAEMVSQLEDHIASLAIMAASKVVEANMDNEKNLNLVEKFLKDEGAA